MSMHGQCEKCGGSKEMYYLPWCPKCDKPEPVITKHLNLIQALRYLEANGHPKAESKLWDYFIDDIIQGGGNDSYIHLDFELDEYKLKKYKDEEDREEIEKLLKIFRETFETALLFEVSW